MRLAVIGLVLATLTACAPSPMSAKAVASHPDGSMRCASVVTVCEQLDDFRLQRRGNFGLDRLTAVPSGDQRFPQALQVLYPAGSASMRSSRMSGSEHGGAQVYLTPRTGFPSDRGYLRYWVRFPRGFEFNKGGKLPGLYGGYVTSGQKIPNGTNGWSTRFMWRSDGIAEVYAYLPSSLLHGSSLGRGAWTWEPGSWHEVEQQVVLNTPNRSDGQLTVWLDGAEVLRERQVVYRTVSSLKVDGLFFSTFFGGGDATWASPKDQHVQFAGFAVARSRQEAAERPDLLP